MKRTKLFHRTLMMMILLFGVISVASTLLTAVTLHRHMTQEFISKGRAIARSIASSSVEVIINRDLSTVQAMVDQFLEIEGAAYVFVEDPEGEIVAHTFVPQVPPEVRHIPTDAHGMMVKQLHVANLGEILDISKPIMAGVAGYVHVGMDMGLINSYIRSTIVKMQALMLVIFLGSIALLYFVVSRISRPLNQLTEYAQRLKEHDFSAPVDIRTNDEVGILADTMNTMASELSGLITNLENEVTKATHDLTESLAHQRAIIENMADGLLVVDNDGLVSLYNPALLQLYGLTGAELRGKEVRLLFTEDILNLAIQAMDNIDDVFHAEVSLLAGRIGKASATAICPPEPLHGAKGDDASAKDNDMGCLGAAILIRDITREKEVDMMKTDFITTVSHELRTPLTSVLGFAKIIKKKLETTVYAALNQNDRKIDRAVSQVSENLEIIIAEGKRLTELINDVLDIAKMESGRMEWRLQTVSMDQVLHHAAASTRTLYEQKNLAFRMDIQDNLPTFMGDLDRLIQVMVNLISNAVKFTEKGSILCTARFEEGQLRVCVSDTGIGIPKQERESVFERFKQSGNTMTDKPKGTGLGLPISREIVEHHGGSIWVESTPGKGSCFTFTLPLHPQPKLKEEPRLPLRPHSGTPSEFQNPEARLVLVVDDDPSICSFLQQVLEAEGYAVLTAINGTSALELAKRHLPDCITMDLLMPEMDGETAIHLLRQDPMTRDIPIVVISAVLGSAHSESDATLPKPLDEETLVRTVNALVQQDRPLSKQCMVINAHYTPPDKARLVRLCSGDMHTCAAEDIWSVLDQGFKGTVIIPAAASGHLDLGRISRYQNIVVIVMPE
jgi:signal transduction histidine kinase/CheY-like chemotaxis protein